MSSFLSQLREASVVIDGVTYPLDHYPAPYIDYLRRLTDDDLVYIQADIEQDGYTPDTAPSDVFDLFAGGHTLIGGRRSPVISRGSVAQDFVESFDGELLFDRDPNHPAGRAAAWCRANLSDSAWAIDIDEFEEDGDRAIVWFVFTSPDDLAAMQAAVGEGA